jgi:N-acetylglutamate synthase-like GNAT family acetyltransferase
MEMIVIRKATEDDIEWINLQYAQIGFKLSNLDTDEILILEENGRKAAIGRIVSVTSDTCELGGIFVLPEFRGRKYAERMVSQLLTLRNSDVKIYCLPFSKLESFYKRLGFRELLENEISKVPEAINAKLSWCNVTYDDSTLLLIQ